MESNNAVTTFTAKIIKIGSLNVTVLPKNISTKLPSRGIVMVEGTINDFKFQTALEPDGKGSHWFKINGELLKGAKAKLSDTVKVSIEPTSEWPEPQIPTDLKKALDDNPKAQKTWTSITPMARWDWIRWINSTKNPATREIRIEKTFSKFNSGIRRPCCFNRTMCTDPTVSNGGVLMGTS